MPAQIEISVELKQLISSDLAHHFGVVPKAVNENGITLYISEEKYTEQASDELSIYLGKTVELLKYDSSVLNAALYKYYRKNSTEREGVVKNVNQIQYNFLEDLIYEAQAIGASDIHIESFEADSRVRFRIDGVLIEKYKIPQGDYLELINKIKIKANLDITEKRLPQDGRINFDNFDLRVSILPTLHGEKVVMRILGKDASSIDLDVLGLEPDQKIIFLEAIKQSNGIILISGPTGSGKTTTLYATLKILNDIKRNIVTVEDPIEYTLQGINQVQLKESIGLTFSRALRSFLRQDPDIIMLGEIRDAETAQMAIRASLTGHLVLSTIHTNSALGTISRLVDMGIPAFYIAETLNLSVAQRLLRKLCKDCKKEVALNKTELPRNLAHVTDLKFHFVPVGCPNCYYTGYHGRRAIYEIVPISKELITIIKEDAHNIEEKLGSNYESLSAKALKLFKQGETSLEEVYSLLIKV